MKYKEFSDWCNRRACDGCWGPIEAMVCISVCETINNEFFWRREKLWKTTYEDKIVSDIVEPINEKLRKFGLH